MVTVENMLKLVGEKTKALNKRDLVRAELKGERYNMAKLQEELASL